MMAYEQYKNLHPYLYKIMYQLEKLGIKGMETDLVGVYNDKLTFEK